MAMITDPDDLIVGTNLTFNFVAKTFELPDGGTLVAKDGVDGNVLWSKFVDLWATATYQPYDFPMNKIDNRSGQYVFGRDPGGNFNGWKPGSDVTRQKIRNAGWSEYSGAGALNRVYFGAVLQGGVSAGAQLYFQKTPGGTAVEYTFTDLPNEAIQVFGDAANGNFDNRAFFKSFCREYGYTYDDVSLTDISETGTGAFKLPFGINTTGDLKLTADDSVVSAQAPYTNITINYYSAVQNKTIGSGSYTFKKVIDNTAAASRFEIYTKMQYLLRQSTDINEAGTAGEIIGKTADLICWFVGDKLYTRAFFTPTAADLNDVIFIDDNGVEREFPYAAVGALKFNSPLQSGGTGTYKMFYRTTPAGDDFGEATATVVKDKDGVDIAGLITGETIPFTFDFSNNTQAGYAGGTERNVRLVWGNPGAAKPGYSDGVITQSKGITISAVAESDPSHIS